MIVVQDLRGCGWVLWEVVGILHGGELQSSEIPFGDIAVFCKGSGDVLLSFMSSS
jgi:hypothetical protein